MSDLAKQDEPAMQAEITRLNKIIQALMNRAERTASLQGSDFNLFQAAITLEDQVRRRTAELEETRQAMEKITRTLRESENRYRLLVENSPVSIHEIDMAGRVTAMNRAGLIMRGGKEESEVQGTFYLDAVSAEDRGRIGALLARAYVGERSDFEFNAEGPGGKILKSCFVPIRNKQGVIEKLMGITEDITERKRAEEQVRKLAFYDTLTQLPNRRLLIDRLGQAMAASKRSRCYGAVMFLDLDNFKSLNDSHGHDVGDLLLIEVAHRIARCLRESDTVARFGGDEFVTMLLELHVDKQQAMEKAGIVAEKIRAVIAEPFLLACKQEGGAEVIVEHHCTSSIGVVVFRGQEEAREDILKWADMAMYQAKAQGRNAIRFFHMQSDPARH
ncbi:GGDEF domain-containing protein [Desulfuromonas sp. CSMB_57]|jgi:diguanylate cyclase (GGDEF)-like protein/PAS domain S-box-containing protein|uniref:GGDEF domain-containing protein n=1 Tax=Desulfuromonas sp. CSMB_57 TaxID=2807629 RepID=UPI001CD20833|nr:GGDEF domain-containing protein [Desulfuromonas sp. CSMB_57]